MPHQPSPSPRLAVAPRLALAADSCRALTAYAAHATLACLPGRRAVLVLLALPAQKTSGIGADNMTCLIVKLR